MQHTEFSWVGTGISRKSGRVR